MIRYYLAAFILKLLSSNSLTIRFYRKLGNYIGDFKRKNISIDSAWSGKGDSYVERGNLLIDICKKNNLFNKQGHVLEIGTGWMHWYGLYLRLHYNVKIDLEDVWDNRQFSGMKAAFFKLKKYNQEKKISSINTNDIDLILNSKNFEQMYEKLNLKYYLLDDGSIKIFPDGKYDCILSFHVLEHVYRSQIQGLIQSFYDKAKPGSIVINQIGIDDHLRHFDRKESAKKYIEYSNKRWVRGFSNVINYHNRLQPSDYLRLFKKAGFQLIETSRQYCDISNLNIDKDWKNYSKSDLNTTILTLVHTKP